MRHDDRECQIAQEEIHATSCFLLLGRPCPMAVWLGVFSFDEEAPGACDRNLPPAAFDAPDDARAIRAEITECGIPRIFGGRADITKAPRRIEVCAEPASHGQPK
jgi:hypothetical protein